MSLSWAEFEKVDAIRRETANAIDQATRAQRALLTDIASTLWRAPEDFVKALDRLREQRGALHGLKDLRYADVSAIAAMDVVLAAEQQRVGERALQFLAADNAFDGQQRGLQQRAAELAQAKTTMRSAFLDDMEGGGMPLFGRANLLGVFALFDDDPGRINTILGEIDKVTLDDVKAAAAKWLVPANRTSIDSQPAAKPSAGGL